MVDEIAQRWLFSPDYTDGAQYRLRGNQMALQQGDWEANTISRDQFDTKLSADDRKLIAHMEGKMERLFDEWKKNDLDSVTSLSAEKQTDEFARRLGKEVVKLLDLLDRAGFTLLDHYRHIRGVVAGYYEAEA